MDPMTMMLLGTSLGAMGGGKGSSTTVSQSSSNSSSSVVGFSNTVNFGAGGVVGGEIPIDTRLNAQANASSGFEQTGYPQALDLFETVPTAPVVAAGSSSSGGSVSMWHVGLIFGGLALLLLVNKSGWGIK